MINRYAKGAREERRIVNIYREQGWLAFRSAGSHSPIDVFALNPITKEIVLIQSKKGTLSAPEKQRILQEGLKLEGSYKVKFILSSNEN